MISCGHPTRDSPPASGLGVGLKIVAKYFKAPRT